jgi:hypothetical protein
MTVETTEPQIRNQDMAEWNNAVSDAIEVEGYTLIGGKENDKTLALLIGVPFLIKNATFRKGDVVPDGKTEPVDYVSLECLIHPGYASLFPRKYIVFNDGSTGIYRQVVGALAMRGVIELDETLPEDGPAHETRLDYSPTLGYDASERPDHITYEGLNLYCPEGVRFSEYTTPGKDKQTSKTWYLA